MGNDFERIGFAAEFLQTSREFEAAGKINFDRAVEIVLKAARDYVDSSRNFADESVNFAKAVLSIIVDRVDPIEAEIDLIKSLNLLDEFGIDDLPLQIRAMPEKIELLKRIFNNSSSAYKQIQKLFKLADYLRISGADSRTRKSKVFFLAAQSAISAEDLNVAGNYCRELMRLNWAPAWQICFQLAKFERKNVDEQLEFLSFSMLFCPAEKIFAVIQRHCELKLIAIQEILDRQEKNLQDLKEDLKQNVGKMNGKFR